MENAKKKPLQNDCFISPTALPMRSDSTFLSLSDMWMETAVCGDGRGQGWLLQGRGGDRDDVETSCGDRGGYGDESCGDGRGWVQISVPMQLSTSYDIRPKNGEGLFWFRRFINLSLTYLLTHLPTYLQP